MANVDAATVVAQLLAFSKDPVRHRHRPTHGREVFPGGIVVFRLAQGRFPQGLLHELSSAERERIRHAASVFIRQVCFWEGASHYQVLCVGAEASGARIKEHYQAMIALIHPDRQDADSPHWPADAASRVNHAYEILADESRRSEYDAGLRKAAQASVPAIEAIIESAHSPEVPPAPVSGIALRLRRARRHFLPALLVISLLFYLQMWWLAASMPQDPGPQWSASLQQYYGWTRNIFQSGMRPRVGDLSSTSQEPGATSGADDDQGEMQKILSHLVSAVSPEVRTLSGSGAAARIGAQSLPPNGVGAGQGRTFGPVEARNSKVQRPIESAAPGRRIALVGPGASPESPRSSQPVVAPGKSAAAAAVAMTGRQQDLESLLLRLVIFYEAGDMKNLLRLFDTEKLGFLQKLLLQGNFESFFRDTQSRSLKIEWVRWEDILKDRFRMTGQAKLVAHYADDGRVIDRVLPLEMTVEQGADGMKITRLSLYPHD